MNGRDKIPREVWAKRIERWLESGLTAREFAAELHVSPNSLSYWKARLSRAATALGESDQSSDNSAGG